jgi:xanthine dehydrogenase YagR molybdenum-binding subunit
VKRVDGPDKVTGAALYSADYLVDGVTHGYLVLSAIAKGTVRAMRVDTARRAPGVLAVYTPFNPLDHAGPWLDGPLANTGPNFHPLGQDDREVRHHGQVIGMVVAETFEQARDAAALIETTYDARKPDTSFEDAIPDAVVPPQEPPPSPPPVKDILAPEYGSIDEALAASEVTVSATYSQPGEHHNAMEPHAAIAGWDRAGILTLHSTNQGPLMQAAEVAATMKIDPARVHVISPYVGGGFGGKVATWAPTVLAAAAARQLGRPVKLVLTREQLYTVTGHRLEAQQTVELGAARDGTLHAVKHDSVVAKPSTSNSSGGFAGYSLNLYRTPNIHVGNRIVPLDLPPATIMRGPSEQGGSFPIECAMDELAHELGIDPITLRTTNNLTHEPEHGLPFSSKHLDECIAVGAQRFGWSRRAAPGSVVDGEWQLGMGMAVGTFPGIRYPMSTHVEFRRDGRVTVEAATSDPGTGMTTVQAIVAADSLGLPMTRIDAKLGDNTLRSQSPQGYGLAAGSAGSASVGPAVRAASETARNALITHAVEHPGSPLHGLAPEDVRYEDGTLTGGGTAVEFGELLSTTDTDAIGGSGTSAPGENFGKYAMMTFAAHFCEVRVNRFTREVRVARMTTVVDAGTILNATAARNQIAGSMIWGLGHALLESAEVEPATGRIANANFADYLVPVNADVADIDVHFLDHPDTIFNPEGSRGVGEVGLIGVAAAIANAVFNATGTRIRDLPITPDKLLGQDDLS